MVKSDARLKFESEIEASWPKMRLRARRRVGCALAEDIVQEAFCVALSDKKWASVKVPTSWVMGVLDNVILRQKCGRGASEASRTVDLQDSDEYRYHQDDFAPDLIDQMACSAQIKKQVDEILRMATVANLNNREDYVVMSRLRDQTYNQISLVLGISINSARAYYSQATEKIRAVVEGENK